MIISLLPLEIQQIIYRYLHDLKPTHNELLSNCARHTVETLNITNTCIIANEITYHKSIHKIYNNTQFWKSHGYCSVKCQSSNWPHTCNFCLICNTDPDFCSCILIFKNIKSKITFKN
jgi:hypothetical protein